MWVNVEETPSDPLREDFITKSREALANAGFPAGAPLVGTGHNVGGKNMITYIISRSGNLLSNRIDRQQHKCQIAIV